MIRTLDAEAFNKIAEHPQVRKWLGFDHNDPIDLSCYTDDINNICLLTDCGNGGYILHNLGNGEYAAHTLATPEARGKPMFNLMRDGFQFLFLSGNCVKVVTHCPDGNKKALSWSKLAGFRPTHREENYHFFEGEMVGVQHMELTYEDWVRTASGMKQIGEYFHHVIEKSQGHENHAEDEMHDRMVGATIEAARRGNLIKAVILYNQWATANGYEPSTILTISPPVLNIGSHVVQMNDGEIEILKVLVKASS